MPRSALDDLVTRGELSQEMADKISRMYGGGGAREPEGITLRPLSVSLMEQTKPEIEAGRTRRGRKRKRPDPRSMPKPELVFDSANPEFKGNLPRPADMPYQIVRSRRGDMFFVPGYGPMAAEPIRMQPEHDVREVIQFAAEPSETRPADPRAEALARLAGGR